MVFKSLCMLAAASQAAAVAKPSAWARTKCGSVRRLRASLSFFSIHFPFWHIALPLLATKKHPLSLTHARGRSLVQPEGGAANTDIITEWGKAITPESVKTVFEYPRPQMVRSSFTNLNGLWEFKASVDGEKPKFGETLNETILVPFPVESCLSGLKDMNDTNGVPPTYQHMWYRTTVAKDSFQATAGGKT